MIKRREITIGGGYDKIKDMRDCAKDIMNMLFPRPITLRPELDKYNLFAVKSRTG